MGFDVTALRAAIAEHGTVFRVVIADLRGSSPRETGAAMLVWAGGQSGTIGGGALEFEAAAMARAGHTGLSRHALGPDLGQCCGGSVSLLTERFDAARTGDLTEGVFARPVDGPAAPPPLAVQRLLSQARSGSALPEPQLIGGWMVEPVHRPARELWIWGAGHVGRAIIGVLAPFPELSLSWVDTGPERFPADVPAGVTVVPAVDPVLLVPHVPPGAEHLIVTYSHSLDLNLCDALLTRGFRFAGLIGSATKWARFRSRLAALGHTGASISRITCPIGVPELGKHPQAIAIGVAAQFMSAGAVAGRDEEEIRA